MIGRSSTRKLTVSEKAEFLIGMTALLDEVEALSADAERYRWLRDSNICLLPYHDNGLGPEYPYGQDLDTAIDAARHEPKDAE